MYIKTICTFLSIAILSFLPLATDAQDRLKDMPGYDQYQRMLREIPQSVKLGTLAVAWKDDGKALEYRKNNKTFRFDIATGVETEAAPGKAGPIPKLGKGGGKRGTGGGVQRARQATVVPAPNGKLKAIYKDRNVWIDDGATTFPVTTEGDAKTRVKYGTACWVYGEELFQNSAMWWSLDGKKLAYYRVDESKVPDYYLQLDHTKLQSRMDIEAYPKAGAPNPLVDIFVYDLASKKSTPIDIRDGKPFENAIVGYYAYGISWTADSKELLIHRTNRKQNIMEFVAATPPGPPFARGGGDEVPPLAKGGLGGWKCRVIVREDWPASWTENTPPMRYLSDKNRFLWTSERNGYKNFYLYELSGKLLAAVTQHRFEVANIVKVDEANGLLYYMARSGDNPMKLQLHRVGLDGKNDRRLTDPALHHAVNLAPDGKHFIDIAETHDTPPSTRLVNADGKVLAVLATSDLSRFEKLGLHKVEMFTFKAGDGKTDLHGMLHKPSTFDPAKKYPMLVSIYAGPATNGATEAFTLPSALAEFGFLVLRLDARSAAGRGKVALDAIYGKLGTVEIDDLACGVKSLWTRPYLDKQRVGIFGVSYGGYASALCLLRYPDVFQAASASSPVTDFRLYDSIYTERYMDLPQVNKKGYDAGSAMTYAKNLKGRLMLFFGTADDNVHPANSLQLIRALQQAGKSFEVQIGPDQGHAGISQARMMEFFIENLARR